MLFALSFLAIVFFTLFPFNFTVPHGMTLRQAAAPFDWRLYDPSNIADSWENILLFLPFGFALACLIRSKSDRISLQLLLPFLASLAFSSSIEFLQQWLPFRISALADICSNTLGGIAGAVVFQLLGLRLLGWATHLLTRTLPAIPLPTFAILFILLTGMMLRGPIRLRHLHQDLSSWDPTYPLAIGNDPKGDRPWVGCVTRLDLASAAISPEKIADAFAADDLRPLLADAVQAEYRIAPRGVVRDLTRRSPDLQWIDIGPPPAMPTIRLTENHWLHSSGPMNRASTAIAKSSAFTIRCQFQSALPSQSPELGRIFAIAFNSLMGNVILGQQKSDLVLRIRGPLMGNNGTNPASVIPEFFVDPSPHTLIITYDDPVLRLYVDRVERCYATEIPVDFSSISRFLARPMTLPLSGYLPEMFRGIFYILNFGTLALLIPVLAIHRRLSPRQRSFAIAIVAVAPMFMLQCLLVGICHRHFRTDNLLWGAMVTFAVGVFGTRWLSRLVRATSSN